MINEWILVALFAFIPAYIVDRKGYNWKLWWLASWIGGWITFVIVGVVAICIRKQK